MSQKEYTLKKNVLIAEDLQSSSYLVHGSKNEAFLIEDSHRSLYRSLLHLLKYPISTNTLYNKLRDQGINVQENTVQHVLDDLVKNNIIEPYYGPYKGNILSYGNLDKYSRQLHFIVSLGFSMRDAFLAQERLKEAHVAILGVGGVRGHIAYALAAMGVGKLTLIDHDNIELSNTSRQILYDETNIGASKLDVAKEKISRYNRDINLHAFNKKVTCEKDLKEIFASTSRNIDLFLLAADTPRGEIKYISDRVCQECTTPFLSGAPAGNFVYFGPFIIPGKTKTLSQLQSQQYVLAKEFKLINDEFVASIMEPYNAIAGNLVVLEAVRFLTGLEDPISINKVHILNLTTMSISSESYDD